MEQPIENSFRVDSHATLDESLAATLQAVERCMRQLELTTTNGPRKRQLNHECQQLLQKAEKIKAGPKAAEGRKRMATNLTEPSPSRHLSTREQIILLKGSKLYGGIFPPWKSAPSAKEFELLSCGSFYTYVSLTSLSFTEHTQGLRFIDHLSDNVELRLSDLQRKIFNGWRRPNAAKSTEKSRVLSLSAPQGRVDLVQDVTSDCSVVASLCALTNRVELGHTNMISNIFYPFNHQSLEPTTSPNGKYILRLHFNGCFRKVVIDDRLPSSSTDQSLHVVDRNHPRLLWPALIEKAYLKIRGGYDFPGSNSGTDLWVLTSWIPEQIFLQRNESSPDALWSRVCKAFKYGDVLVTVGTGRLNQREEEAMGLAGEHDYSVIDMEESEGKRRFLVKNPWSEGTTWTGGLGRRDCKGDSPGTFWMSLNDVYQSFESMYLNWNPALFSFREDIHFNWELPASRNPIGSFGSNPQFRVRSTVSGTVWLLLSRHFKTIIPSGDDITSTKLARAEHGFISLYVFDKGGERIFVSDGATLRGTYVDSPNTLVKLDLPALNAYTIVVSEQNLPVSDYSFTLSAFSLHPLVIEEAQEKYSHYTVQEGAWTSLSSGGNANSSLYHTNPQFSLTLSAASEVSFLIESTGSFPVHVKLLWAKGNEISTITTRDILADSGEYRKGYAFMEVADVQAGTYTIVCSTFEPGQLGKFKLRIGSMSRCIVDRVRSVAAGRLVLDMPATIFTPGVNRLLAPLLCQRITRVSVAIHCRPTKSASVRIPPSPLKLGVEWGQGPTKNVLAVSGDDEFMPMGSGIRTNDIDILPTMCDPRGLWVVIQRPGGSDTYEEVAVEIMSDGPVSLGPWGTGDG